MEDPILCNTTVDDTVKRVEQEGLEARNLINWITDVPKISKKPPSSPRPQSTSPNPLTQQNGKANDLKFLFKPNKRRSSISRPKNRLRSASAGRNPEKDLRARYWTFLFENLHRAVDEIYQTCEMDESIVESKEAIMMLENYSKDFHALIQWLNISKSYEKTAPLNRPTSLAWEVRKSSPGKSLLKNVFIDKLTAGNSQAKRVLCFDAPCDQTLSSIHTEVKDVFVNGIEVSGNTLSRTGSEQEKSYEKSENSNKNNQSVSFSDKHCDVKISVHKSTEDLFPCNKDLVINEITVVNEVSTSISHTPKNKSEVTMEPLSKIDKETNDEMGIASVGISGTPSNDMETEEFLNIESNKLVEKKEITTEIVGEVNESFELQGKEPVKDAISRVHQTSVIEVSENSAENSEVIETNKNFDNSEMIETNKNFDNSEVIETNNNVDNSEVIETNNNVDNSEVIEKNKNFNSSEVINANKDAIHIKEKIDDITVSSVIRNKTLNKKEENDNSSASSVVKNKATNTKEVVNSSKKTSPTCTVFNNDVAAFPKIKDTIGIKSCVKRVKMATIKPIKKSASSELLHGSSKASSISSEQSSKVIPNKKDEISKPIAKSTGKSEPTHLSKSTNTVHVELSRNVRPASSNKSSVSSTLTRSKTCLPNSTNKTSESVTPSPPTWGSRPISFSKPINTPTKKIISKAPVSLSERRTLKTSSENHIRKNTATSSGIQEKSISTRPATTNVMATRKVVPIHTVSHAIKQPQKSGSLSSLHVPSRNNLIKMASSAEHIADAGNSNEDSDGWETVRGRTRSRNSPAKKIPQSSDLKNNEIAQIAKLNQSRIGGFPYTTKTSKTTNVPKTAPEKKNDSQKEKLEVNKDDGKSANQRKASSTTSELMKKKSSTPSCALNRTPFSVKKSCDAKENNVLNKSKKSILESSKEKQSDEVIADIKSRGDTKSVIANSTSEASTVIDKQNQNLNLSENLTENKLLRREALTLPLNVHHCDKIFECSYMINSKHLLKSSSAPSLCDIYEEVDFSYKKALSDTEQVFDNTVKKNIKLYKKKCSNKALYLSRSDGSNERDTKMTLDENDADFDENDAVLSSVDQDDMLSHDDVYDVQTQELYDTARRYKILEEQVHKLELSWGEQMDRLDMELRTPGRALEMHEKLSSPFRKRSIIESIRLCNEKQVKAQEQREKFLEEKAQKFKDIQKKRQEMKALVEQRQEQQRIIMEQKLERAEKKRKKQLEIIVKKAHDEEEKVNEIAFINTLEAQNKRHDLISKEKDHEARLQDIQDERQRRQEEKAAKEAAAEERRKILEAERQARLIEMQEKRKLKDLKIEQQFLEKEKERQELANQKARDRELRISALNAAQQTNIEELQKKIQLKQEESARRHEENMEQIRLKAFELSVRRCSSNNDDAPQPVPYETKKICTICNVLIGSEVYLLSHLRGKKHQEAVKDQHQGQDPSTEELELYNLKHIVDASTDQLDPNIALDKERQKALKKRCKKLRQRMSSRGLDYESQLQKMLKSPSSNVKNKMEKIINDIKKLFANYGNGMNDSTFLNSLDRLLEQLHNKGLWKDKASFSSFGGVGILVDVFSKVSKLSNENNAFVLKKIVTHASKISECFIENCYGNCYYALFSNKIGNILNLLIHRLNTLIPDNFNQLMSNSSKSSEITLQVDLVSGKLMHFLSGILLTLSEPEETESSAVDNISSLQSKDKEEFQQRVQDSISYIVSIGIVDKLAQFFNSIQGPINNEAEVAPFLLDSISFLVSLIKLFTKSLNSNAEQKKTEDTTQLIATFKLTNIVGSVSLLYGLLLHSGASSRGDAIPLELPQHTIHVTLSTLCMWNHVALMNLQKFQSILGSEGLSLQLRHITSHLLWYCSHWTSEALLHEVILLIGYFTVLNPENQLIIQAGQRPTVLQQLCSLPFLYFSDSQLIDILFPTLISCCFSNNSNKTILEQEMSSELLSNYVEAQSLNIHQARMLTNRNTNSAKKRWLFSTRFPMDRWSSAKQYFSVEE